MPTGMLPLHAGPQMPTMLMLFRRLSVAGSLIGGIAQMQEMLDFCAQHNVTPDCEIIKVRALQMQRCVSVHHAPNITSHCHTARKVRRPVWHVRLVARQLTHGSGLAGYWSSQADYVNEAYERMLRSDVKYRFVIDMLGSVAC